MNYLITIGSSSSMGSYFRGENLSDFELDELNSGNDSGNDNTGRIYEFIPDSISKKIELNIMLPNITLCMNIHLMLFRQ